MLPYKAVTTSAIPLFPCFINELLPVQLRLIRRKHPFVLHPLLELCPCLLLLIGQPFILRHYIPLLPLMSCHPGQVFLPGAVPLAFPLQQDGCQACCSSHHPYPVHTLLILGCDVFPAILSSLSLIVPILNDSASCILRQECRYLYILSRLRDSICTQIDVTVSMLIDCFIYALHNMLSNLLCLILQLSK